MNIYTAQLIGAKPHILSTFNYTTPNDCEFSYTSPSLLKISYSKVVATEIIAKLKFTNNPIRAWIDSWQETDSTLSIDPVIVAYDLSANEIELASFLETRYSLDYLDLRSNRKLAYVNLEGCLNLRELNLSNCTSLNKVCFGLIDKLQVLSLNSCNLSEDILQDILGNLNIRYSSNISNSFNKPKFNCSLDLRGNYINWNNRLITSKIRMFLTNNIQVLWDNNPPPNLIPISYYKSIGITT